MKSYGQKVKEYREHKGLTQEEMAKTLEITRPTYNAIETDKRSITITELQRLCNKLDLTLEQFLFSSSTTEPYEGKMVRFKQIILHCLQQGTDKDKNPWMSKVKLAGLVYLCDFTAHKQLGRSLSDLSYRRGEKIPFVDAFYRMVDELYDEGSISIKLSGSILLSSNEPTAPRSTLEDDEVDLIKKECGTWRNKSTHDVVAYIQAESSWQDYTRGQIVPMTSTAASQD